MLRGADSTGSNSTGADQKLAPSEKSSTDIYLPAARSADFSISGVGTLSSLPRSLGVQHLSRSRGTLGSKVGNRKWKSIISIIQ